MTQISREQLAFLRSIIVPHPGEYLDLYLDSDNRLETMYPFLRTATRRFDKNLYEVKSQVHSIGQVVGGMYDIHKDDNVDDLTTFIERKPVGAFSVTTADGDVHSVMLYYDVDSATLTLHNQTTDRSIDYNILDLLSLSFMRGVMTTDVPAYNTINEARDIQFVDRTDDDATDS